MEVLGLVLEGGLRQDLRYNCLIWRLFLLKYLGGDYGVLRLLIYNFHTVAVLYVDSVVVLPSHLSRSSQTRT